MVSGEVPIKRLKNEMHHFDKSADFPGRRPGSVLGGRRIDPGRPVAQRQGAVGEECGPIDVAGAR